MDFEVLHLKSLDKQRAEMLITDLWPCGYWYDINHRPFTKDTIIKLALTILILNYDVFFSHTQLYLFTFSFVFPEVVWKNISLLCWTYSMLYISYNLHDFQHFRDALQISNCVAQLVLASKSMKCRLIAYATLINIMNCIKCRSLK